MSTVPWQARPPFGDLTAPSSDARGVIATERDGLGIANVIARQGQTEALRARFDEHFGLALPTGLARVDVAGVSVMGMGPGAWLAIHDSAGNAFALALAERLDGLASVTDQSDGYAVLRLAGPKVRATLAKLVPLDVHDRAFAVGAFAGTVAAHMTVLLWRLADAEDGAPVFEIAVFRSMTESFWHALTTSAAEFGFTRG